MSPTGRWKNKDICRNAGMNADAHQEATPACATTWKRTRYLMYEGQSIGRRGGVLPAESSEPVLGLDAIRGLDDVFEDVLEREEAVSCAISAIDI